MYHQTPQGWLNITHVSHCMVLMRGASYLCFIFLDLRLRKNERMHKGFTRGSSCIDEPGSQRKTLSVRRKDPSPPLRLQPLLMTQFAVKVSVLIIDSDELVCV